MQKLKFPKSDRIESITKTGIVVWKKGTQIHGYPPRPTLSEKMYAIGIVEDLGLTSVIFPYPGETIHRCEECGWDAKVSQSLCYRCYSLTTDGVLFSSVRNVVRARRPVAETEMLAAIAEATATRYATLAATLMRHVAERVSEPDRSLTTDCAMLTCTKCEAIVVTAAKFALCPGCRGRMS